MTEASPQETLTPAHVLAYLKARGLAGEVVRFSQPTPTVEEAARVAGVAPEQIVKTLLFFVRYDDGTEQPWLVLAIGPQRVDRRILARFFGVGRKRVRLARADEVPAWTGYAVGAVPPLAHRQPLPALMDERILAFSEVWAGGGAEDTLLRMTPQAIRKALGAQTIRLVEEDPS
ncbi:MAG TPA: YbaK/EbsC family protein [Anaerolineae bacterium]|nr:YbaK/EbsC family protein [Anaerolineae bacterium]HID84131.1 YbaK/EbsC family protein [Anaerolineales bacterium]